jgi:hypothetical protein
MTGAPRLFKSEGTSTTTPHAKDVDICVQLLPDMEVITTRDMYYGKI